MAALGPVKRIRRRRIGPGRAAALASAPLAVGLALFLAPLSRADNPIVEAAGGGVYGYYWSPAGASVAPGGSVTFKNASPVLHGVSWKDGPVTPSCSGVPVDDGKGSWTGTCAFAEAGTYSFYCSVHPTEMKGAITATAAGAPGGAPPPPSGSPDAGPIASGLKLAKRQRGSAVRGMLRLLEGGPGSRIAVVLRAPRARLLGPRRAGSMRVGRLVRSPLPSGPLPFAVPLSRLARASLREIDALPLTVTITVTSPAGEIYKRTRKVIMQ